LKQKQKKQLRLLKGDADQLLIKLKIYQLILNELISKNMISLYDYLGHAAGPDLGKRVAAAAAAKNIQFGTRHVENKSYTGQVLLYPKTFLDEFFGGTNNTGKQLLKG